MKYINFNNAGCSFPSNGVNKLIYKYLKYEEIYGGYYAVEKYKKKLDLFYENLSKLINCKKTEVSFLPSTTNAWNIFFNSLKIPDDSNIVILDNEYGSNLIYFKKNNINLRIVKTNNQGKICLEDLKKKINSKTLVVCVCHIASQCGDVIDVVEVGRILRKINKKIIYVVDACQSIGHLYIDVKKIDCDVLVGSGRKYLRGPRGTGFIFLHNRINSLINPSILDLKNSKVINGNIKMINYRVFENFEYSPALKIGLNKAIEELREVGLKKIENNIKKKSLYLREKLKNFYQIKFYENTDLLSGINTFNIIGLNTRDVYTYLLSKNILSSISTKDTSYLYFKKRRIKQLVRISFHSYNTFKEINYLIKCLIDLIKK